MAEAVHTIADFLAVVRKSGLVSDDKLTAAVAAWPDDTAQLPDDLLQSLIDAGLLTQWQIDQLRRGKHKGFMLGKYKLLGLLGAGGMSSVYLAENPSIAKQVAIKVLPVKRVEETSFLARFEREARVAFQLGHQNIARAFDKEQIGAIHFIVMEYVEGVDLYVKVKEEGPLDVRDAANYIRQAAVGLHYAHEEGLVHRDIKPANLILDRRGTIKILDLGLALEGDEDDDASLTKAYDEKVLGTADYLAPEQARDSHKADRRSDIYALGCSFYYILVGRAPYASGKLAERIQAHLNKPPPNILEARPDVPPTIAELYFRMMAKSPEGRPQTAEEVANILDAWLKGTAGSVSAAARAEPPRRIPPRRPGSSVVTPSPTSRSGVPRIGGALDFEALVGDAPGGSKSGSGKTGDSGSAKSGDPGSAKSGDSGPGKSGDSGPGKSGDSGPGKSGDSGSAKSGDPGPAKTGEPSFSGITVGPSQPPTRPASRQGDSRPAMKAVNARQPSPPKKPLAPSQRPTTSPKPSDKETPSDGEEKPSFRFPRKLWGQPVGLWIAILGGTIAVIVLGVMVLLRQR